MEKVLVICDDLWHPAEVIEKGLAARADGRFSFDIVKAAKDILLSLIHISEPTRP